MKKIFIVFIILSLFACAPKQEPTVEPEPTPEPAPTPEPVVIKEKEYVLSDGWMAYDFDFDGQALTYTLKDKLVLKLSGEEKEASYCSGKCTVFDTVTVNDKHLDLYEKAEVKLNDKVGHLYMYNLNNQLYLLCFYTSNSYDKANCLVFDDEGKVVMEWTDVALTMNSEQQNTFLVSYLKSDGSIDHEEVYTANGKDLEAKDF